MFARLCRLLICSSFFVASASYANLIVNGSFESPGAAYTSDYAAIASNTLPSWTSTVGNGTGPANYLSALNSSAYWIPNPQSGSYCVQLDSSDTAAFYSTGASLSQTVALTAGVSYLLTFYMSAETNGAGTPVTSQINVILNGGGFANQNMVNPATGTTGFQASWSGAAKANPEPSWVQWGLTFTPTVTGNVTIKFQDVWVNNSVSSNSSLDNIDLSVVPEMTHWSIFALFATTVAVTNIFAGRSKRLRNSQGASR